MKAICDAIVRKLVKNGQSVVVAKASTGGLISAHRLFVSGESNYFLGGSVIYTRESRRAFLEFNVARLKGLKPLTHPMTAELGLASKIKLDANWSITELGAAGPNGTP